MAAFISYSGPAASSLRTCLLSKYRSTSRLGGNFWITSVVHGNQTGQSAIEPTKLNTCRCHTSLYKYSLSECNIYKFKYILLVFLFEQPDHRILTISKCTLIYITQFGIAISSKFISFLTLSVSYVELIKWIV